jgi:SSS family solute:Na+ symporter
VAAGLNVAATAVFVALFAFVTAIGFLAGRWRRGDLTLLHEWGLGGRRFGTFVTWFLLGGDLYTAYTFIAVPAVMFGAGATGFFAVPYTIMIYPLLYVTFPRLWTIARRNHHVTSADIVRGRFGNRWLALAVALTGIVATMPYIALQLVGMQVVIGALGLPTAGFVGDLPLIIAFLILAGFTYSSGLRAPAMIAVVKDVLIYATVIAAVVIIPARLGGFSHMLDAVPKAKLLLAQPGPDEVGFTGYATLALGSALALFLYPHSLTAILSSSSARVIRRNAALLPAYSLVLGLLALLGFMAIAVGVAAMPEFADGFAQYKNNFAVPALFLATFPSWFAGVAFAAVAIGALVPAAIMSIATANTFTRNIWREFIDPDCTDAQESQVAKIASLVVKAGALAFIFALDLPYALQFQLLGGIWMIQILPALLLGLYVRLFNGWGLLAGWAAGVALGTWMSWVLDFKTAIYPVFLFGTKIPCYAAIAAVLVNIAVSAAVSLASNPFLAGRGRPLAREDYA